jgi:pimeloyl-ACP methyl ester carboxylesterase
LEAAGEARNHLADLASHGHVVARVPACLAYGPPLMTSAAANGITIEYETTGDPADPALLLVMGLGAQLIAWHPEFRQLIADRGFHVIVHDNRDTGLSSKIEDGPAPDVIASFGGDFSSASYTLSDMAADSMGVLDALGIESAHVVGASMGGMIAQTIAIEHPARVRTLCSIMSMTGASDVGAPTEEAMAVLMKPPPETREEIIANSVVTSRIIGSTAYPTDEAELRARSAAAYDRCFYPVGIARQLVAIRASGDRTEQLGQLDVPTLVIHGDIDPLVRVSGGEATAKAIPGADLLVIEGMGHDNPTALWPRIVDAIVENAAKAG